jgi:hypothetical protein
VAIYMGLGRHLDDKGKLLRAQAVSDWNLTGKGKREHKCKMWR